jgi:hypothetical protein
MQNEAIEHLAWLWDTFAAAYLSSPTMVGLLGFVCGSWFGHRLTLSLDRRRERNEAAEPIREYLLKSIGSPWADFHTPSEIQMDRFEHCLPYRQRARFRRLYVQCHQERDKARRRDDSGGFSYPDTDAIVAAYRRLLPMTRRR